jgi:cardiolipin synthase
MHFVNPVMHKEDSFVQVVGSGPDSEQPYVLFSILQAIYLAKEEILITTPYFIPGDNILDALRIAASSGLSVKLLVPGKSDSRLVNAASKANYHYLLKAGVEIYLYKKGFVHAKTMVTDGKLSMIGTANMDYRSYELNFEVNAIVYDVPFAENLRKVFFDDLKQAQKLDEKLWDNRAFYYKLADRIARLFSPAL